MSNGACCLFARFKIIQKPALFPGHSVAAVGTSQGRTRDSPLVREAFAAVYADAIAADSGPASSFAASQTGSRFDRTGSISKWHFYPSFCYYHMPIIYFWN
jgi:hypothetical protein